MFTGTAGDKVNRSAPPLVVASTEQVRSRRLRVAKPRKITYHPLDHTTLWDKISNIILKTTCGHQLQKIEAFVCFQLKNYWMCVQVLRVRS